MLKTTNTSPNLSTVDTNSNQAPAVHQYMYKHTLHVHACNTHNILYMHVIPHKNGYIAQDDTDYLQAGIEVLHYV